ncbi:hypothetical protein KAV79_06325 [Candidatus Aerophobetes bacterium]|nr:hypothetical protein [Candidatus Aerophobetes bacterium]
MRKKFYFLAAALISLLILLLVFVLPSLWRKPPEIGENLVKNSSFEKEKKGKPTAWEAESWARDPETARHTLEEGKAFTGTKFVMIENLVPNHAAFTQIIRVKENSIYKIYGWIKTKNVGRGNKGANIGIEGKMDSSKDIRGSNGKWKPVELYARTGEDVISFNLMLNLGGYASLNTGKAFFDEIVVEEVENVPRGAHVVSINWEEKGRSSFQSTFSIMGYEITLPKDIWKFFLSAAFVIIAGILFFIYVWRHPVQAGK